MNPFDFYDIDYPRDHYKLWWRFLRRSQDYKKLCFWVRKKKEDPSLEWPDEFLSDREKWIFKPIVATHRRNGDVHVDSFKQWYEYHLRIRDMNGEICQAKVLQDYQSHVCHLLGNRLKKLTRRLQREPSAVELIECFSSERNLFQGRWYVLDAQLVSSKMTLDIVRDELKSIGSRKPNIRYDAIKKHIKAYDLQVLGKTRIEIAAMIYPGEQSDSADTLRKVDRHLSEAKRIIKKAENGLFPGSFSDPS